jgi:signal transduction histidine kinase
LTEAAQRAARGDLGARVEVRTSDEVGRLGESFNVMASALEHDQHLRRQLASDVAHELRTPLTNIRCELEAVQDGLRVADATLVTSLHEEIIRLARLVDDLQELSTTESGEQRLELRPVRARELVSSAAANFEQRIRDHNLTLRQQLMSEALVNADSDRIVQVLRNFLSNAIEHSADAQEIAITLRDDGRRVRFEVEDRLAPALFESFQVFSVLRQCTPHRFIHHLGNRNVHSRGLETKCAMQLGVEINRRALLASHFDIITS